MVWRDSPKGRLGVLFRHSRMDVYMKCDLRALVSQHDKLRLREQDGETTIKHARTYACKHVCTQKHMHTHARAHTHTHTRKSACLCQRERER